MARVQSELEIGTGEKLGQGSNEGTCLYFHRLGPRHAGNRKSGSAAMQVRISCAAAGNFAGTSSEIRGGIMYLMPSGRQEGAGTAQRLR